MEEAKTVVFFSKSNAKTKMKTLKHIQTFVKSEIYSWGVATGYTGEKWGEIVQYLASYSNAFFSKNSESAGQLYMVLSASLTVMLRAA